jgi:hypothetical protein
MVPTVQLTHSDAISTMNHHHGTYCSINTLRRYINHESSSWHLLFNEHTQTLYQPWIIIMVPTVQWTHSDAISTMNHHHGTYCSANTLRRYINHESSSWYLLFWEHTQTLYQPWIIIMVPTVLWTHSDAISTMNHHHGTYCSVNTLRRYINHESSSWYLLFNEHTQTLYQPWITPLKWVSGVYKMTMRYLKLS